MRVWRIQIRTKQLKLLDSGVQEQGITGHIRLGPLMASPGRAARIPSEQGNFWNFSGNLRTGILRAMHRIAFDLLLLSPLMSVPDTFLSSGQVKIFPAGGSAQAVSAAAR